ncbi:MAG TPA: tetratricopeptide repeat protein [Candidatus Hypogeohydataceae bacterium YC41]
MRRLIFIPYAVLMLAFTTYYSFVIEAAVEDAQACLAQGNAYFAKGDYDRAISFYSKALEINPRYSEAYNNRGGAYNGKGQYDQAVSDFNKALEINPKLAEAYYNRGLAYQHKGQYDQAISDHNKALEINPRYAVAYNNRGIAFYGKGQHDQAISDYNSGGLLANPYASVQLGPNLLANPGFESGFNGWSFLHQNYFSIDSSVVLNGSYSLRLADCNIPDPNSPDPGYQTKRAWQSFFLTEGKRYRIGCWIKLEGVGQTVPNSGIRISLMRSSPPPWPNNNLAINVLGATQLFTGTQDWFNIEKRHCVVNQTNTYDVRIDPHGNPDGIMWFDDFYLQEELP